MISKGYYSSKINKYDKLQNSLEITVEGIDLLTAHYIRRITCKPLQVI